MKCPHCTTDFHENWFSNALVRDGKGFIAHFEGQEAFWHYRTTLCSKCKDVIIEIAPISIGEHNRQVQSCRLMFRPPGKRRP
jgi:hypothetical protein